jgi:hypothetical protein
MQQKRQRRRWVNRPAKRGIFFAGNRLIREFESDSERTVAMSDIPIHNETDYDLPTSILNQIKREALEYFGESIRAIRVQYGIDRHAFNAKTGEMRYAFSPGDFGLIDTTISFPEPYHGGPVPSIDDEAEEEIDEATYDDDDVDVDVDADDTTAASLESLSEDLDDTEDDDPSGFQGLDNEFDEIEDDDREFLYEEEEEEE